MKKERIKLEFLQNEILKWFASNQRIFPWRVEPNMNSYRYIISEILLQRTKAETVAKFYSNFISKYTDWKVIDLDTHENIQTFLKPIGLSEQRSKRLKMLANVMVSLNGHIPNNRHDLEKLPFLGQYITNAILLLVYNERTPLLDVNMARVLERYFGKRKLADIRYDPYLQKLAFDYVDHPKAKELNWAILDYASLVCKAKPLCNVCNLKLGCINFNKS